MKSSLAMARGASGRIRKEAVEGSGGDAGPEEESALRAVDGPAIRAAGHLQERLAEPVIGGVAEPDLTRLGMRGVDEGLAMAIAQDLDELGIVLRLLVGRAGGVAEIDADQADASLGEHVMRQHPSRSADIAPAVQTGQPVHLPEPAREAVRRVV